MRASWIYLRPAASVGLALVLAIPTCAKAAQAPAIGEISSALRQGDTEKALVLAQTALAAHPDDCRVLSLQALAYMAKSRPDPAHKAFQHALKACPDYLPALEGDAQIKASQNSPAAIPLLNRLLALQPDNSVAQGMLGVALQHQGDCKGALPHFAASQPVFPTNPLLEQGYAACLVETGDLTSALPHYQALASTHTDDTNTLDLALLQLQLHQPDAAMETLRPLLATQRSEPASALGARIAESMGDTPRAVQLLRTAILLAPDHTDNYLDFASLAFSHSSFQVGIDMVDAGLRRMPSAAALYLARGVLEMQISKQEAAVTDFQQAHRLDPKLTLSEDALGIVQTQQHQDKAALSTFREQAGRHPDDPLIQYLLAEQLAEGADATEEQLAAAIAAARRSAELDPSYVPAHDLLAKLYLRAQQPTMALQEAQLALKQDPNDQEALYQELMARRRTGDAAGAQALVSRLNVLRKQNAEKQQAVDRYRLIEAPAPPAETSH